MNAVSPELRRELGWLVLLEETEAREATEAPERTKRAHARSSNREGAESQERSALGEDNMRRKNETETSGTTRGSSEKRKVASSSAAIAKAKKKTQETKGAKKKAQEKTKFFTASWCPPCQLMYGVLDRHPSLAAQVELIDIDENERLARRYDIQAVPTFVRPDGARVVGAMSVKDLRAFLSGAAVEE